MATLMGRVPQMVYSAQEGSVKNWVSLQKEILQWQLTLLVISYDTHRSMHFKVSIHLALFSWI